MRLTLTLLILAFTCSLAHGQINLKAAYRLVITDPTTFNGIIQEHNESIRLDTNMFYTNEFKDLKVMNGFDMGLRYKVSTVAVEVGWMHKRRQLRADGRRINGNSFQNKITTSMNSISAGLFPTFGPVSIGGTVEYNYLKIKNDFEEPSYYGDGTAGSTFKDQAWSSHFSVSYNFSNGGVLGVTIRPYIDIYWSEFDLTDFNQALNNPDSPPDSPLKETFASWGISFILYNGPQPYR